MNVTKALVVDDSKVAHLALRKLLMERNIEVDWVGIRGRRHHLHGTPSSPYYLYGCDDAGHGWV